MTNKKMRKGNGEYLAKEENFKWTWFWVLVMTIIIIGFSAMVWQMWVGY